jgi:hypothetical protein
VNGLSSSAFPLSGVEMYCCQVDGSTLTLNASDPRREWPGLVEVGW